MHRHALPWMLCLACIAAAPAAAAAEEKAPAAYPEATDAEKIRIRELLGRLVMPPALARAKEEFEAAQRRVTDDHDLGGPKEGETPEAYARRQKEELAKLVEEIEGRVRSLVPGAHRRWRQQLDEELKDFGEGEEVERLQYELRSLRNFERSLFSEEAPSVPGIAPAEMRRLEEAREREFEKRHQESEALHGRLDAFYKDRSEAMKELASFGHKAVPFLAEKLSSADFDSGAAMVEVLSTMRFPLPERRFFDAFHAWFDRQAFSDPVRTPKVLQQASRLRVPDMVAHASRAVRRTPWKNRVLFLGFLYQAAADEPRTIPEAISAVLSFMAEADGANREVSVNILNLFLQHPKTHPRDKRRVLETYRDLAWRKDAGKNLARVVTYGLGATGLPEAVPHLERLLNHKDLWVRIYAIQGLGRLGPTAREASPALLNAAEWSDDPRVYRPAILALGRIKSRGAVDTLIAFLESEDETRKKAARVALRTILGADFAFNVPRWRNYWAKERTREAGGR